MTDGSPHPAPTVPWLTRAGRWARRPQTAMGAVFLMTAASSFLVLARKHRGIGASLSVHEQGAPVTADGTPATPTPSTAAVAPDNLQASASPQAPAARAKTESGPVEGVTVEDALALQQKGELDAAIELFRSLADRGDARARFLQGKAEKDRGGCSRARDIFARLAVDPQAGPIAFDARLEEGRCARKLEDEDGARRALQTLLDVPSHRERALAELSELD